MAAIKLVGSTATPTEGSFDDLLRDRLEGQGHTVTIVADTTAEDITGMDALIISESCGTTNLGGKYTGAGITIPVLVFEHGYWDEMGFKANGGTGSIFAAVATIDITDDTDDLAGGLTGTGVTLLSTTGNGQGHVPTADLGGNVHNVGRPGGQASTRSSLFWFDSGVAMGTGTNAPALRIGWGVASNAVFDEASGNAWDIFDAAVVMMVGSSGITVSLPLSSVAATSLAPVPTFPFEGNIQHGFGFGTFTPRVLS